MCADNYYIPHSLCMYNYLQIISTDESSIINMLDKMK